MLVAIAESCEPLQEGDARAFGPLRKVFEITRVAHRFRIDEEAQIGRQLGDVIELEAIAVAVRDAVARQVVHLERAQRAAGEQPEIAAQIDAAAAVFRGFESGIRVRRDVPVERHRELQAAALAVADCGEQEAALALGAERKRHPRQIHDRHAFEIHARATARADAGARVERDAVGAQLP